MQEGYIDCFKYKSDKNELENIYYDKKLFVNPPFSKMTEITEWVIKNSKENIIALLIPSRTDTEYFHKLLKLNPTIYFIKGRLHYNDSKSAPFPTILMFFTNFNIFPIWNGLTQDQLIEKIKKLKWY